jgi:hypothetical protein
MTSEEDQVLQREGDDRARVVEGRTVLLLDIVDNCQAPAREDSRPLVC